MRTCKAPDCKERHTGKGWVVWCSHDCGAKIALARLEKKHQAQARAERKTDRERKVKLKSRADWLKEAQGAFNAYIRQRDAEKACISCGRYHEGQWHAGHYLSVGARPELRFDENNVHKQCQPCNTHLHGNIALYRAGLNERCGGGVVAWLEGPHEPRHYTIEDLKAIKTKYRALAKALTRGDAA